MHSILTLEEEMNRVKTAVLTSMPTFPLEVTANPLEQHAGPNVVNESLTATTIPTSNLFSIGGPLDGLLQFLPDSFKKGTSA